MSSLAWIDFDEAERQRMQRLIGFFFEQDSRDELGLGAIRDFIAERLFPGTSTIHTRLRYVLFVPWIFQALESRQASAAQLIAAARSDEIRLIDALLSGRELEGVIGRDVGAKLQRLPSSVYWSCLGSWGIRLHQGSIESFFASTAAQRRRSARPSDVDDERTGWRAWHASLPPAPPSLLATTTFDLSSAEADFLVHRLAERHPQSLLTLLARERRHAECDHVWTHPDVASFPVDIRRMIDHARIVSQVMHGAALLYNLQLSELCSNETWIADYRGRLDDWERERKTMGGETRAWRTSDLWQAMAGIGASPHDDLRKFVEAWRENIVASEAPVADSESARILVREREERKKRQQSRFSNSSLRSAWRGEAGTSRMTFRWPQAKRLLKDIADAR